MNINTIFNLDAAMTAQYASSPPTQPQLIKLLQVGVGFAPAAPSSVPDPFVDVDALVANILNQ